MEPKPTLIPSLRRMYAFDSDEQIPILGSFEQTIAMNNITANATFYVINNKAHAGENLLGFKTLTDFNVVQIVNAVTDFGSCIKRKYKTLFEDRIGRMLGVKVHIDTDTSMRPTQQPHYQVPYHMIPGTKDKLQELIDQKIIEKVSESQNVTWISPMLPVEKGKCNKQKGLSAQQRQATTKAGIRITSDNKS